MSKKRPNTTVAGASEDALTAVLQLRSIDFFKGLSADELGSIAQIASEVKVAAGDVLFELGDEGDRMYIISLGLVDVLRGEQQLARLGRGDCFGEMALLDRTTRSATIRAVEDTELVAIARDEFYELLEIYPTVSRAIVDTLLVRLRKALR